LNSADLYKLLNIQIQLNPEEVYNVEEFFVGIYDLDIESLMKISIKFSKVEQRELTINEIEKISFDNLLDLQAVMTTNQGVQVSEIDLSDLSLDELLKMNTENKIEIRVKKNM